MARRTVGKPRFFADIPSYLKVKGYFEETALEGVWDNSLQETNKDSEKIWTFDPSLLKKYNLNLDIFYPKLGDTVPSTDIMLDDTPSKLETLKDSIKGNSYLLKSPKNIDNEVFEKVNSWEEFLAKV